MTHGPEPRTRIKICGLTREQDVDAAVEAGADAVGFVLYAKSPRFVTPARAAELAKRLPPFVTPVLLFVNAGADEVNASCEQVGAPTLQFHGDETPEDCARAAGPRPWLRAARIPLDAATPFDLLEFAHGFAGAQALLLDAHVEGYGGAGKAFHWSRLPPSVNCHAVLSGGLTPANVTDGIVQVRPRFRTLAVDVSSGVEASKGVKDPAKIHQFVAAVRAADALLARPTHALLSTT
jgi:phosphoribosylanthranilate isomerase